jgi:hypothetical protein
MSDKVFTEDEAMHLVAREVAKQRMSDMERKIDQNDHKTTVALTEIKQQISQVIVMIDKQSLEQEKSDQSLKVEIEKEFASKLDLQRLESKLDSLSTRIYVAISVIAAVGAAVTWAISTFKAVVH